MHTLPFFRSNASCSKNGFISILTPNWKSQINDRISFKKFLGLSFDNPSPDHSAFSRFRKRLSKNAMDQINSAILRQFEQKGININEGIAIDARLVKSASRQVSNKKLKELRQTHNTGEGRLYRNRNLKKFCRDLESDWTAMKDTPFFGLKEHAAVDVNNGFNNTRFGQRYKLSSLLHGL